MVASTWKTRGPLQAPTLGVTAIVRANPNSRAFCELEGSRFRRMHVAYNASLNEFILRYKKKFFVDEAHLNRSYEETILAAIARDVDDHLFDITYPLISAENNDD